MQKKHDVDYATRFNYILWLQDLLDTTSDDYRDKYDPDREVVGVDMWACSLFFSLTPAISIVVPLLKSIALNAPG